MVLLSPLQIEALRRQDSSAQLQAAEQRLSLLHEEAKGLRSELARLRVSEETSQTALREERERGRLAEQVCGSALSRNTLVIS